MTERSLVNKPASCDDAGSSNPSLYRTVQCERRGERADAARVLWAGSVTHAVTDPASHPSLLSHPCPILCNTPYPYCAILFNTPQYSAIPHNTLPYPTILCHTPHYSAIPHTTLQYPTLLCNTPHYSAIPHNTLQYPTLLCNTPQYSAIPHTTLQYPTIPCNVAYVDF